MKTLRHICQLILLICTLLVWIVFICGADSLLENNMMFPAVAIVAFDTYLCHLCIKKEDIEEIFHTKIEDDEI